MRRSSSDVSRKVLFLAGLVGIPVACGAACLQTDGADNDDYAMSLLQTNLGVSSVLKATKKVDSQSREAPILLQSRRGVQEGDNNRYDKSVHHHSPSKRKKSVAEVFQDSGTDKLFRHGYHRYYETELEPYRDIDGARILEIGADTGKSLGAWLEYFTSPAAVGGVAYSATYNVDAEAARTEACALFPDQCDKLQIYYMDQSNVSALNSLLEQNRDGWDVVIDDGSHVPQHQLISFQKLWPNIRPGGLYVIEDIETSYVDDGTPIYGYELHGGIGQTPPENTVEQFKRLVDVVNRKHFDHPKFSVFAGVDKDVARVSFADGLIFVQKKPSTPDWDKYPTALFATKQNTAATFNQYEKSMEGVNSWFKGLE
jgi:hypothetical protein